MNPKLSEAPPRSELSHIATECFNGTVDSSKGNFKTEIQKLIADPSAQSRTDISLKYPGSSTSLIESNLVYRSLKMEYVRVASVRVISSTSRAYLANAEVTFFDGSGPIKSVSFPFYVGTDTSGVPNFCVLTSVTDSHRLSKKSPRMKISIIKNC